MNRLSKALKYKPEDRRQDSKAGNKQHPADRSRRDRSNSRDRNKYGKNQKPFDRNQSKNKNFDKQQSKVMEISSNERDFDKKCQDIEDDILGYSEHSKSDNRSTENNPNLRKHHSREDALMREDKKAELRKMKSSMSKNHKNSNDIDDHGKQLKKSKSYNPYKRSRSNEKKGSEFSRSNSVISLSESGSGGSVTKKRKLTKNQTKKAKKAIRDKNGNLILKNKSCDLFAKLTDAVKRDEFKKYEESDDSKGGDSDESLSEVKKKVVIPENATKNSKMVND